MQEKFEEDKQWVKENWSPEKDLEETMENIEELHEFQHPKEEYLKKEEDQKKIEEDRLAAERHVREVMEHYKRSSEQEN